MDDPRAADDHLLERLPEPVLLVTATGGTLVANSAFTELAARYGAPAQMASLFGQPVRVLMSEARRKGSASAFLPLVVGEDPSLGFRVHVRAGAEDGTLAVQLTDLSEEVAWRHQLFLRNSELSVLNDIGAALSATLELDALALRIWEQTGRIMDHTHFELALHEPGQPQVHLPLRVEDGVPVEDGKLFDFGNGPLEHVLNTRQPLLLNGDVNAELVQLGLTPIAGTCASYAGVPILSEGQAIGVIALKDFREAQHYGRHELGILRIIATQAGAALRNARLYEATKRAYEELSATQARLLEGERLRGVTETVGALNHEVNNPLATIVGTAQLMLRVPTLEESTRIKAERMLEAAKRIQAVTSKMATLIQAHSRTYPGQTQILDLSASLAEPDTGNGASRILRVLREPHSERPGPDVKAA